MEHLCLFSTIDRIQLIPDETVEHLVPFLKDPDCSVENMKRMFNFTDEEYTRSMSIATCAMIKWINKILEARRILSGTDDMA